MCTITFLSTILLSLPLAAAHQKKFCIDNKSAGTVFVFTKRTYGLIRPFETGSVPHKKEFRIEYQSNAGIKILPLSDKQKKALTLGGRLLIKHKGDLEIKL